MTKTTRFHAFLLFSGVTVLVSGLGMTVAPKPAAAAACRPDVLAALQAPASTLLRPVEINCDLSLQKGMVVTAPIAFSGSRASNTTLDCNGAVIDGRQSKGRTVLIRSLDRRGQWDVPHDITIRNCTIIGDVRVQGLGANGQADKVKASSLQPGHTQRAQSSAPAGITFSNVSFVADGGIPLYLAPGVTGVSVEGSRFSGTSTSTVIYLDAESARNRIVGNLFKPDAVGREVIALDGSAENLIQNNSFFNPVKGGIFVYRNCGEGGTVRQQQPQRNVISGNEFRYSGGSGKPAVWLGSRQGFSVYNSYCLAQPKMLLGGLAHDDDANDNVVTDNRLPGAGPKLIVDDGSRNRVANNR